MELFSTIIIPSVTDTLLDALEAEREGGVRNERSQMTFKKVGDDLVVTITSKDATAFRANANSLAKLLMTFEKMQEV